MKVFLYDETNSFAQIIKFYLLEKCNIDLCHIDEINDEFSSHPLLIISDDTLEGRNIIDVKLELGFPFHISKLVNLIFQIKQFNRSYQIGDLIFQPSKHQIIVADNLVKLTQIEAKIIDQLILASDNKITKDMLCEQIISANSELENNNIENHIYRINTKLPDRKLIVNDQGFCSLNEKAIFILYKKS